MSLFDAQDLAEISHPDYPGEQSNHLPRPRARSQRTPKRADLLAATDELLAAVADQITRGTLTSAGEIGKAERKVIDQHKIGKHFHTTITDTTLTYRRDQAPTTPKPTWTPSTCCAPASTPTPSTPPGSSKATRTSPTSNTTSPSSQTDDLDLQPIHHRLNDRVKAHVLICLLACSLVWHLREASAPLTFTDEHPPARDNPVAPAQRSADAHTKAARKHDPAGNPLHSFHGLLDHLATLTRNQIHHQDTNIEVPMLTETPPNQRHAFDLLNIPIPLTAAGWPERSPSRSADPQVNPRIRLFQRSLTFGLVMRVTCWVRCGSTPPRSWSFSLPQCGRTNAPNVRWCTWAVARPRGQVERFHAFQARRTRAPCSVRVMGRPRWARSTKAPPRSLLQPGDLGSEHGLAQSQVGSRRGEGRISEHRFEPVQPCSTADLAEGWPQ